MSKEADELFRLRAFGYLTGPKTQWERILEKGEPPVRYCQALNDSQPRHEATHVVERDRMQWFSCEEHIPRTVRFMPIKEWWETTGLISEV